MYGDSVFSMDVCLFRLSRLGMVMVCTICKRITCPCWTHVPVRINGKIIGWEKRTMTYPPEDYYDEDRKRLYRWGKQKIKGLLYFFAAVITTIIIYKCIDNIIIILRESIK